MSSRTGRVLVEVRALAYLERATLLIEVRWSRALEVDATAGLRVRDTP